MKVGIFFVVLSAVAVLIAAGGCAKKEEPVGSSSAEQTTTSDLSTAEESVEQTTCPVMEGPVNKDIFVEYKGKKVYFCCPSCKDEFQKNPEAYLPKLPQFQK